MRYQVVLHFRDGGQIGGPWRDDIALARWDTVCNRGGETAWIQWNVAPHPNFNR